MPFKHHHLTELTDNDKITVQQEPSESKYPHQGPKPTLFFMNGTTKKSFKKILDPELAPDHSQIQIFYFCLIKVTHLLRKFDVNPFSWFFGGFFVVILQTEPNDHVNAWWR